jgi:hypothetical protein
VIFSGVGTGSSLGAYLTRCLSYLGRWIPSSTLPKVHNLARSHLAEGRESKQGRFPAFPCDTMNPESTQEKLLRVLRERDIPFDRRDIEAALKNEAASAWVEEYLGEETLLTKEELAL